MPTMRLKNCLKIDWSGKFSSSAICCEVIAEEISKRFAAVITKPSISPLFEGAKNTLVYADDIFEKLCDESNVMII